MLKLQIEQSVQAIRTKTGFRPELGIILEVEAGVVGGGLAQLLRGDQCKPGGLLLGIFLGGSPGAGELAPADRDGDLEALGVVWAFLVEDFVGRLATELLLAKLDAGDKVKHPLAPGRHAWVHVAEGEITINGTKLSSGDAVGVSEETALNISASQPSQVLLFDLN